MCHRLGFMSVCNYLVRTATHASLLSGLKMLGNTWCSATYLSTFGHEQNKIID